MSNIYDEETHTYYIDGEIVPSVTQIAKPISFEEYSAIPKGIMNFARERGTLMHEYIELYLLLDGELDWDEIENEVLPYMYAFEDWYKTYKPKIIYTEYMVFHGGLKYAGRLDLLCEIDGKVVLIDYKATSKINHKSLKIQHYGYKRALSDIHNINVDECYVLQLKKDQTYVFKKIEPDEEWFMALLLHAHKMEEK